VFDPSVESVLYGLAGKVRVSRCAIMLLFQQKNSFVVRTSRNRPWIRAGRLLARKLCRQLVSARSRPRLFVSHIWLRRTPASFLLLPTAFRRCIRKPFPKLLVRVLSLLTCFAVFLLVLRKRSETCWKLSSKCVGSVVERRATGLLFVFSRGV
jgi:hypothetical protein